MSENSKMNRIELDQHSQDIILACKGYYREDNESPHLEGINKAVGNIIGRKIEDDELYVINHWIYDVYMELLKAEGTCVHESHLKEHLLGTSFDQRHYTDRTPQEHSFWFLKGQIQGCRVHDKDYELVLNLNEEIVTERDLINREARNYNTIRPDCEPQNSPYIFKITFNKEVVEEITNDHWMTGYGECENRIKILAKESLRKGVK